MADTMPEIVPADAGDSPRLNRADRRLQHHNEKRQRSGLKPKLITIRDAADYSGVSRSTFYARFLPRLESIRIGKRRLILLASLDELIERLRGLDAG